VKPSQKIGKEGPAALVVTKGYSTTQSLSTLRNLLASKVLRQGDGIPASRRKERLFGVNGTGRSSLARAGAKLDHRLGDDYHPAQDTCLVAFVRFIAAEMEMGESTVKQ